MNKFGLGLLGVALVAAVAFGAPVQKTVTTAAAGTAVAVPSSAGGSAYKLQSVLYSGVGVHTVQVVVASGAITNDIGTKTTTAYRAGVYNKLLVITNCPWLVSGDYVRLSAVAAVGAETVVLSGTME